jgi:hypothetical protein
MLKKSCAAGSATGRLRRLCWLCTASDLTIMEKEKAKRIAPMALSISNDFSALLSKGMPPTLPLGSSALPTEMPKAMVA